MSYADVSLFIDGSWSKADRPPIDILNPATGERIGGVEHAAKADLDKALAASGLGISERLRLKYALESMNLLA